MSLDLSDRYGTRRRGQRTALIMVSALLALVFLVWLGWVTWFHSTPGVTSEMQTFEVEDQHAASAVIAVRLDDGVEANCKVRALAEDHVVVGEQNFVPREGRNAVEIRTDRLASSIELVGCTAPGQNRPR